ncbi:MAG: flagellar motor switch protein FliN [Balneolales bacterium]
MIVDKWKIELEKHLPNVKTYLANVLKETAEIKIDSVVSADKQDLVKSLDKNDVFIITRDEVHHSSIILILDNAWLGLLSSIMMGVEEDKYNEITRDLLKKFVTEMLVMLKKQLRRNGLKLAPGEMEVLTHKQMEKKFVHEAYFHAIFSISGLGKKAARAELLIGYTDDQLSNDDSGDKPDQENKTSSKSTKGSESRKISENMEDAGDKTFALSDDTDSVTKVADAATGDQFAGMSTDNVDGDTAADQSSDDNVVTGRKVEFDNFEQTGIDELIGDTRNMALLKDVEMEVSVQLGQIEMPLGKVLQLSKGSIIELNKLAGEPVDILVNGSYIAHGEVVVIDEHFGVRISNLITTRERITRLR